MKTVRKIIDMKTKIDNKTGNERSGKHISGRVSDFFFHHLAIFYSYQSNTFLFFITNFGYLF